jgi:hypothetical protein
VRRGIFGGVKSYGSWRLRRKRRRLAGEKVADAQKPYFVAHVSPRTSWRQEWQKLRMPKQVSPQTSWRQEWQKLRKSKHVSPRTSWRQDVGALHIANFVQVLPSQELGEHTRQIENYVPVQNSGVIDKEFPLGCLNWGREKSEKIQYSTPHKRRTFIASQILLRSNTSSSSRTIVDLAPYHQ